MKQVKVFSFLTYGEAEKALNNWLEEAADKYWCGQIKDIQFKPVISGTIVIYNFMVVIEMD